MSNAQAYIDQELEGALIRAIAADPSWYHQVREILPTPARDVAAVLAADMDEMRQSMGQRKAGPLNWGDSLVQSIADDLAAAEAARVAGQRTIGVASSGLPSLDVVLNGWQRGALYVLGGA